MRIPKFHLTTRTRLIVAAGVIVAGTSGVAAFNLFQPATADEPTPTEIKVQEHEGRITKNESDIAETKDRVTQVEQQTEQNTQAIGATKERVTVVERQAAQAPSQVQSSAPTPSPTPAPRKTDPRLVTGMTSTEKFDRFGEHTGWECTYTLGDDVANARTITTFQGYPCHAVGTDISSDLAAVWGIK